MHLSLIILYPYPLRSQLNYFKDFYFLYNKITNDSITPTFFLSNSTYLLIPFNFHHLFFLVIAPHRVMCLSSPPISSRS